eukprot:160876_1
MEVPVSSKLTKIKSRYKVVEDWQEKTNEFKLVSNIYRNHGRNKKPLPSKVRLVLFAYLYKYRSTFSKTFRGSHISITSDDGLTVLNKSNQNPQDFNFRGQLIRMQLPLIPYHTNVRWEIYFEKMKPPKKTEKKNETKNDDENEVFIKASIVDTNDDNNDNVRVKITNFDKFISMNME